MLLRLRGALASARAPARALHASAPPLRGSKHLDWYVRELRARELAATRVAPLVFPAEPLHARARARAFVDFSFGAPARAAGGDAAAPAAGAAAAAPAAAAPAGAAAAPRAALHRVVFELADDVVPVTVANWLALAAAPRGARGYAGAGVFKVQKGHAFFVGDAAAGPEGREGHSAFRARYFPDENFVGRHAEPFVLAMASSGVHSNGSVFYVTLARAPHLGERGEARARARARRARRSPSSPLPRRPLRRLWPRADGPRHARGHRRRGDGEPAADDAHRRRGGGRARRGQRRVGGRGQGGRGRRGRRGQEEGGRRKGRGRRGRAAAKGGRAGEGGKEGQGGGRGGGVNVRC